MSARSHAASGAGGILAGLAAAIIFIAPWEGKATVGYFDIIGVPTYCYGGTGPEAVVGKHYTDAECKDQLSQDVRAHAWPLQRCIKVAIPEPSFVAIVSLSFNVGPTAVCQSSVVRYLNAGDLKNACARISVFNRAGGHVVRGLVRRRAAERALCEKGLA